MGPLNISKSESYAINQLAAELPLSAPCNSGFKYLGIAITRSVRTLWEQNCTAFMVKVMSDLQRWGRLPLSLARRVQVVKINLRPKYLYIFQCLPIYISQSCSVFLRQRLEEDQANKRRLDIRDSGGYLMSNKISLSLLSHQGALGTLSTNTRPYSYSVASSLRCSINPSLY